jgi:hypothetical protein
MLDNLQNFMQLIHEGRSYKTITQLETEITVYLPHLTDVAPRGIFVFKDIKTKL